MIDKDLKEHPIYSGYYISKSGSVWSSWRMRIK